MVVVDAAGNPVTGHDVLLSLEHPDADGEPKAVAQTRISSESRHSRVTLMAPHGGSFSLVASTQDAQGRQAKTSRAVWSAGELPAAKAVTSQPLEIVSEVETLTAGNLATFLIVPLFRGCGIAVFEWVCRPTHRNV
ncbi:MAG: hypothetical protein R3E66_14625 [bacterium]